MSRIGRKPIVIPAGVEVNQKDNVITVKGPKGEVTHSYNHLVNVKIEDGVINVTRPSDDKEYRSLHGLTRTLINNMVIGVTEGYKKELDIVGVGYRAQKQGSTTTLNLGFSHPVELKDDSNITIEVPAPNKLVVHGIDKQLVGQYAADIRKIRPPEPYKGKGIRYTGEFVIHKEGKAGKAAK